jgi:hypothetical protein
VLTLAKMPANKVNVRFLQGSDEFEHRTRSRRWDGNEIQNCATRSRKSRALPHGGIGENRLRKHKDLHARAIVFGGIHIYGVTTNSTSAANEPHCMRDVRGDWTADEAAARTAMGAGQVRWRRNSTRALIRKVRS